MNATAGTSGAHSAAMRAWQEAGKPRHAYTRHPLPGSAHCWTCGHSADAASHLAADATRADVQDAIRRLDERGDCRPGPRAEQAELRALLASMPAASAADALAAVDHAQARARDHMPDSTLGGFPLPSELAALRELAETVRAELAPAADADVLAAEAEAAARRMAPPVPGVTRNMGYTVFAVLPGSPAGNGTLASWHVAAQHDTGSTVTWTAYASEDGTNLGYDGGHYTACYERTAGAQAEARAEALVSLADRASVFGALDELSARSAGRAAFADSRALVMRQLHETEGIARPVVRDALAETAALGSAELRHRGRTWRVTYDRMHCTFSVSR